MWRKVKPLARFLLSVVGIVILTSFTIDATDTFRGSNTALSLLAERALQDGCPSGMGEVSVGGRAICVDQYENSIGSDCRLGAMLSSLDTKRSIEESDCESSSKAGGSVWTHVTFHQAKQLCAKRNTRLPTSAEWYEAALGTPADAQCHINGSAPHVSGDLPACVSSHQMYDLIGNVWEWVDEEVRDGVYNERALPESGYVQEADTTGVALATNDQPVELFDSDYFWSGESGTFAMMRGGFFGSREDAGLYAVHTKTAPSFSSAAIGFRCVKDL